MEFITNSDKETKALAAKLAKKITHGIIALTGDLGAGKTTFVQGFAKGAGIKDKIISPTFVLIRQHQIPNCKKVLYHIDLYRLENSSELNSLGIEELLSDKNIVLIEWAEKGSNILTKESIQIYIEKLKVNQRKIKISGPGTIMLKLI